jgi:hypothetical protein
LFLLLFVIQTQAQQGGMWIPSLKGMKNRNEESRHENQKDIYDVNQSSMKDAVPHFLMVAVL